MKSKLNEDVAQETPVSKTVSHHCLLLFCLFSVSQNSELCGYHSHKCLNIIIGICKNGESWKQVLEDRWVPGKTFEEAIKQGIIIINLLSMQSLMWPALVLSWMQSATSRSLSSKSKVPQVNLVIRPARDPEKQGACARPLGDLVSYDQTRNKSPNTSCVPTCDKSWDSIHFGWARSSLINKWQTVGMVCNQWRHMTPVIG